MSTAHSRVDSANPSVPGVAKDGRSASPAARQGTSPVVDCGELNTPERFPVSPCVRERALGVVDGSPSTSKNTRLTEGGSVRRSPSLPGGTSTAEQERLIKHQRLEVQLLQLQRKLMLQEQLLLQQKAPTDAAQGSEEPQASVKLLGTSVRGAGDGRPTGGVRDKRKNGGRSEALKAGSSARVVEQGNAENTAASEQARETTANAFCKTEDSSSASQDPEPEEVVPGGIQEGTTLAAAGVTGASDSSQRSVEGQEIEPGVPAAIRGATGGRVGNRVRAQSDFTDISLKKKGARIEDQFFR